MINKIFVFGGLALMAILIVENMVLPRPAFVFIDQNSKTWMLAIVSSIVWAFIGYGLCNMIKWDNDHDEDLNF